MSTIRKDKYGMYVKTGGYIFRPILTECGRGRLGAIGSEDKSKIKAGDRVKARHIGGSGLGVVGDETWHSHGTYYNGKGGQIDSESVWTPVTPASDPKKRELFCDDPSP